MNANQIISMIVRTVMRQLISRGVRAGMDAASGQMGRRRPSQNGQPVRDDRQV